ncbi:hypothetical protein HW509_10790 [Asaia spathodeae]|uniref:hypothetical protein n=1 Tax=Asaia spathodeae TaxID=657016 RepID=UPI002FC36435
MPYDSNGNYILPSVYKATPGTTIMTEQHNTPLEDVQAALNKAFLRDGTVPFLANINANGFRITGLAAGTGDTDAANIGQLNGLLTNTALTGNTTVQNLSLASAVADWESNQVVNAISAANKFIAGLGDPNRDIRVISLTRNGNDKLLYALSVDGVATAIQAAGDYATNSAVSSAVAAETTRAQNAEATKVSMNSSQGPAVSSVGIVSASGQPYCVDTSGRLRYLVKSPGTNSTDVPVQSVGINNQRIYVSYNNDTQAAWLVRSPAEGSTDTRVGSIGINGSSPYFAYGGANDASSPMFLAKMSDIPLDTAKKMVSFQVGSTPNNTRVNFPIGFSSAPEVYVQCRQGGGGAVIPVDPAYIDAGGFTLNTWSAQSTPALSVLAIGYK